MNQAPDSLDKYCFRCGGELEVSNPSLGPVPGLPGRYHWSVETVCSKCGDKGGTSWNIRKVSQSSLQRAMERNMGVGKRRGSLKFLDPFLTPDGRWDFVGVVRVYPLSVFGLKGHPLGLKFSNPVWGSVGGQPDFERKYHASFRYFVGNNLDPEKALCVRLNHIISELDSIEEVALRRESLQDGTFHRDWNEEQIQQVSRQHTTVQIGGQPVDVDLASWEQPQRVILAHLDLAGLPATAAALNLTEAELFLVLGTLVALKEDPEALVEHQQDLDENFRDRRQQ